MSNSSSRKIPLSRKLNGFLTHLLYDFLKTSQQVLINIWNNDCTTITNKRAQRALERSPEIQQATPGGCKSEVMFKNKFSKIWPGDLVFDLTWPILELGLDIMKTNLLTKIHQNQAANVASRV